MPIFRLVLYGSDQTDRTDRTEAAAAATGAWHLKETPGTLANRGNGNGCLAPDGGNGNGCLAPDGNRLER